MLHRNLVTVSNRIISHSMDGDSASNINEKNHGIFSLTNSTSYHQQSNPGSNSAPSKLSSSGCRLTGWTMVLLLWCYNTIIMIWEHQFSTWLLCWQSGSVWYSRRKYFVTDLIPVILWDYIRQLHLGYRSSKTAVMGMTWCELPRSVTGTETAAMGIPR